MGRFDSYLQFVSSADEVGMASQLVEIAAQMRIANVTVGLTGGGHRLFVSVGAEGKSTDRQIARDRLIHTGCLAKPLTATLIAEAIVEGRLGWHDDVANALGVGRVTATQLAGVTIQQLLNHTHGLDASSVKRVPRTAEGLIDVTRFCEVLGSRKLSAPGALYSYSDAGGWLAGAVLEVIYRRTYSELLAEKRIFRDCDCTEVCPATGGSLRLRAREWLEFLETYAAQIATLGAEQVPLPGWGLFERGCGRGWKSYAGGWLGHNSSDSGRSAVLRFHPHVRIGIIASADGEGAAMLALAGLVGQTFPELFTFRMPRRLPECTSGDVPLHPYRGHYLRSNSKLEVTAGRGAVLSVALHDLQAGRISRGRQLHRGRDDLFVPEAQDDPGFPFVQFVRPDAAGVFEYVWNGRYLWRRE